MLYLVIFAIIAAIAVYIVASFGYIVNQQSVVIIERLGKFHKVQSSGFHLRLPLNIDKIAARVQLRLLQTDIILETKTKDNVFVNMSISVQFRVKEDKVVDAFYKLNEPDLQIKAYIEDALRSSVPKLTLDEIYEKKDEIALDVLRQVHDEMIGFGYVITKTLITKVEPDVEVKQAMNEINASQRKRVAAQELAEADKIKIVTAAEAEAEKDRLHGVGIAQQRKAIVDGLAESIQELRDTNINLSESEIMSILLTNQYLDTLNTFAQKGNQTLFLSNSPTGVSSIQQEILSSMKVKDIQNQ